MEEHVATADEEKNLLHSTVRDIADYLSRYSYEFVWIVNESTGKIERGECIHTLREKYFRFEIVHDPTKTDRDGFSMIPVSNWIAFSDEEEAS